MFFLLFKGIPLDIVCFLLFKGIPLDLGLFSTFKRYTLRNWILFWILKGIPFKNGKKTQI